MTPRVQVGRRVIGRRVIGSANPVAKWGRESQRTCLDSIGGFFLGLVLFCVPFWLTYNAGTQEKDSRDIARLEPQAAESLGNFSGKGLVSAPVVTPLDTLRPPKGESEAGLLAYDYKKERWETWTEKRSETETRIEDGQEVEYTYEVEEEVSDWVVKEQDLCWSKLAVGGIAVDPAKCEVQLDWQPTYHQEYTDAPTGDKYRETVEVVLNKPNMLLAGEFLNGQIIAEPDFYILTPRSKDELVDFLNRREETTRYLLLGLAVLLMTVSFNLMLGPAMLLINIIPIRQLTAAIRFGLGVVSLFLSLLIVGVTYLFVRYWWVIVLLLIALAVWLIVEANRHRKAEPDLEPDQPAG